MTHPNGSTPHGGAWTEFICVDSGIVLQIRKVPFTLTDQLHKEYERLNPAPKPPMFEIDYGDEKIREPNYADPVFLARLQRHEGEKAKWVNEQARHVFAELAIDCTVDSELVAKYRAEMNKQGITLDASDKFVYIWDIAIGTTEGHLDLFSAIQRRSGPTAQGVADALARFQLAGQRA